MIVKRSVTTAVTVTVTVTIVMMTVIHITDVATETETTTDVTAIIIDVKGGEDRMIMTITTITQIIGTGVAATAVVGLRHQGVIEAPRQNQGGAEIAVHRKIRHK